MSPADERRRLVQAAQRREPYRSDEWFGQEPGLRASLDPASPPKHRGWTFFAVSAGLVVGALGACWALASSDSIARWTQGAPDHAGTTEVTSAPTTAEVGALPNAVPTTVQPAVVPPAPIATQPVAAVANQATQPTPLVAQAAPQPVVETAPKLAPVAPAVAAPIPVESLPAAAQRGPHHEPAGNTTIHVVETPEPLEPSSNE